MRWAQFVQECPELAEIARSWIADRHILLLGTLRSDGTPRISAVECDLVGDDLCTGMIWQSVKALDLLRDPRMTVHSLPPGMSNPEGDLKFYGTAVPIEGKGKWFYERTLYARIQWQPSEPYHCFAYDFTSAALVRFRGGGRDLWLWREGAALHKVFRPDGQGDDPPPDPAPGWEPDSEPRSSRELRETQKTDTGAVGYAGETGIDPAITGEPPEEQATPSAPPQ